MVCVLGTYGMRVQDVTKTFEKRGRDWEVQGSMSDGILRRMKTKGDCERRDDHRTKIATRITKGI